MDALTSVIESLEVKPKLEFLSPEDSKKLANFTKKMRWARDMRKKPTKAESILRKALQPYKIEFRMKTQHVMYGFIADFAFFKRKVIIEADGSSHNGREEYDNRRDEIFRDHGWRTFRFTNKEIITDTDGVISRIRSILKLNPPQIQNPARKKQTILEKLEQEFKSNPSNYSYQRWISARKGNHAYC